MTVIQMPCFRELGNAPVIVLADLQAEYIAEGRAYAIENIDACLNNCRVMIDCARSLGLPIAHFRQLRDSMYFNRASSFSDWIEEFRPRSNEMVFERTLPSCYSNSGFCDFLEHVSTPTIILAGLTGAEACLSTAIDALHKNHKLIFIKDASASCDIGELGEEESHNFLSNVISIYADVATTDSISSQLKKLYLRAS